MKIGNNSSLIGFKGTEDLGNGLKSLFQIETGVNINGSATGKVNGVNSGATLGQSNTNAWNTLRDSYVGLNSKYGTALAGFLSTPYRSTLTSFDVMPGATGDGRLENMLGQLNYQGSIALNSSVRATAVAYAMPTLYGFNGSIAYTVAVAIT